MKKKVIALLLTATMCLGLSACGKNKIPEMTEDQLQLVGEYAAFTLMKYDAGNRSRLVDLNLLEVQEPAAQEPSAEQNQAQGMKPTADTPVENQAAVQNSYSMEEVMGVPDGVSVTFVGQESCDKYPYEGDDNYFAVVPSAGRRLLVLKFSMENMSGQDVEVDNVAAGCTYQIVVNGNYTRRALTTMLLDDMSTFKGTLKNGDRVELVLVIETDEEKVGEVSTAKLNLKNESKTHTIQLF